MKAINTRKGNSYKSQALLHGLHFDLANEADTEPSLSNTQDKLIEDRMASLKAEKMKGRSK